MDVEWGYTGERGPEHWAELCDWFAKGAAFELQSPIPLTTCEPAKDQSDTIAFHYQKQRFTRGYKRYKETSGLIEWKECQIFHSIFT